MIKVRSDRYQADSIAKRKSVFPMPQDDTQEDQAKSIILPDKTHDPLVEIMAKPIYSKSSIGIFVGAVLGFLFNHFWLGLIMGGLVGFALDYTHDKRP